MSSHRERDLPAMWLPLLRRLTETLPIWGLWKNAESALQGSGDFDSTAPEETWPQIIAAFAAWAREHELGPVAACRHVPGVLFLVAVDRSDNTLVELDVNARKYFRGWTVFRPEDLAPLMEIDAKGFRRVRQGAEGIILLTQNGMRWGGRPDHGGLAKRNVRAILQADPEGMRNAARLFGIAERPLLSAAESVTRGEWSRGATLMVEARAVLGAFAEPGVLKSRFTARRVKKLCPVLTTIFSHQRYIQGDLEAWTAGVAANGELIEDVEEQRG